LHKGKGEGIETKVNIENLDAMERVAKTRKKGEPMREA
jgi:hypothetical protein